MLDTTYFKNIDTEEKAYFLGYLVADGSISKTTNRVSFTINSKDDYILERLKQSIGSSNSVRRYKVYDKRTKKTYNTSVFQFSSKEIKEDLATHGVTPFKSKKFEYPYEIKESVFKHFLKGMMDGDGYISDKKFSLSLISTKEFLEDINKKLFKKPFILFTIKESNNVYRAHIQQKETCLDFLDYLYKDSKIHLDRKYKNYIILKNLPETRVSTARCKEVVVKNDKNRAIHQFKSLLECADFYQLDASTICYLIKNKTNRNGETFHHGKEVVLKFPYKGESDFLM